MREGERGGERERGKTREKEGGLGRNREEDGKRGRTREGVRAGDEGEGGKDGERKRERGRGGGGEGEGEVPESYRSAALFSARGSADSPRRR